MNVMELCDAINGKLLTESGEDNQIACGYTCDLLSWVMAKGDAGCAWVTVQTHLNVVAVASLHDMACIITPEDIEMEPPTVKKANAEGIAIVSSPLSAYEICGILRSQGVPAVRK